MGQHRLSARVEFSPAAEKLYLEAKNKSEFILNAIEFYATYGKAIHEDLQEIKQLLRQDDIREIKQLLHELKSANNGAIVQLPVKSHTSDETEAAETMANETETQPENSMTEEERQLHESVLSTLGNILGGGEQE